jgi:hypothetical protein
MNNANGIINTIRIWSIPGRKDINEETESEPQAPRGSGERIFGRGADAFVRAGWL